MRLPTLFRTSAASLVLTLLPLGGVFAAENEAVTLEGTIVSEHPDVPGAKRVPFSYLLQTDRGQVKLTLPKGHREPVAGTKARVHGRRSAEGVDVAADGLETTGGSTTNTTTTTTATMTKKVAVLLINFKSNTSQPWTTSHVNGLFFSNANSVANYFAEESYGKLQVTGRVFPWMTISADTSTCGYRTWRDTAKAAAANAGIDLSTYTQIVYAFPRVWACGWPAIATLPGRDTWLNGTMTLRISSHELGHNFGVHHSSTMTCVDSSGTRVPLSSSCSTSEYGDPFDVMGRASTLHTHNWHRYQLGFHGTGDTRTVTTSGTYALGPAAFPTAAPKLLRVARPDGSYLYLEYRRPYGSYFETFSSTDPAVNGVTIRIAPDLFKVQSKLIDTQPSTSSFSDAPLSAGRTFVDPIAKISVTTTSVSSSGASVKISMGTTADTTAPTAPTNLKATLSTSTSAALSWTASTDNRGVAGYRVYRDGTHIRTTTGTTASDSGLSAGRTYRYSVSAYDAAGNVSASAAVSLTTPGASDTTPPTTPTGFRVFASGQTSAALSWTASTDNKGVAGYRVYRDGTRIATTSGTTASDSGLSAGRTYRYSVVAYDGSGNVSAAATAALWIADVTPPTAPTNLVATATSHTTATISWSRSTDNVAVAGYRVYRGGSLVATTSSTSLSQSWLVPGATYRYSVRAVDRAGNQSEAVQTSLTMPLLSSPSAPEDLEASPDHGHRVDLEWDAASDDTGVAAYRIFRNGSLVDTVWALSDTDRPGAGVFTYAVAAVDRAGNMGPAALVSVTVP